MKKRTKSRFHGVSESFPDCSARRLVRHAQIDAAPQSAGNQSAPRRWSVAFAASSSATYLTQNERLCVCVSGSYDSGSSGSEALNPTKTIKKCNSTTNCNAPNTSGELMLPPGLVQSEKAGRDWRVRCIAAPRNHLVIHKAGILDSGLLLATGGGLLIGSHTVPRKPFSPSSLHHSHQWLRSPRF